MPTEQDTGHDEAAPDESTETVPHGKRPRLVCWHQRPRIHRPRERDLARVTGLAERGRDLPRGVGVVGGGLLVVENDLDYLSPAYFVIKYGSRDLNNLFNDDANASEIVYGPQDWDDVVYDDREASGPYCPMPPCSNGGGNNDDQNKNKEKKKKKSDKYNDSKPGHEKNARKSTENKHSSGDARRQKDWGNEKGDARRPYRRN